MLGNSYFYNKSLKRVVAIFGTLFNNISVAKTIGGKMTGIIRVPLAYGPRQKFLARLASYDQNAAVDVAVRLPRMSFEITSIAYDPATKLNKLNSTTYPVEGNSDERIKVYQSAPYILSMQLNIMARHQDDASQILEQILPYFCPDYTVTVKDMEGPGSRTDLPIVLQSVAMQDDYEGDFMSSRRTLIYTLDFNIKVKFAGPFTNHSKIIKEVDLGFYPHLNVGDRSGIESVHIALGDPENDTPENFTTVTTFGFDDEEQTENLSPP
jgi:hypothetical protein